ncbi:hypothetical protein LIX60_30815 [Streptomyces sp. S07_1.15]|uniref:hypothetical protein n=1 Tax=Streptomyces sp. S07_1.15 TaxID=2873925 RepID=UPI001D148EA6|nr:hypothetical protein [Streptomyces sp. S07_1.15]MCC3655775.1 hypothetical protein [Streptomyces sp. S07_1.15]
MFNDLASIRVRRFLYLSSALLLVIAIGTRILLGGEGGKRQVFRELTSSIAGAIIVWALSIIFLGIFLAREKQAHETRVIDGDASAKQFSRLAADSTIWYHHGQIGRWVRENVVPAFILRSARSPAPLRLIVILLDPRLDDACKAHADRRNSRRRREPFPFTARHIKIEIASTVLSLAKAKATISSFEARVFVTDLDNPFRIDLCDSYGFVTHEDQTAPAFGFEADSPYFATSCSYFEKFKSMNAREINLDSVGPQLAAIDAHSVQDILTILQLDFPELSDNSTQADIVKKVEDVVR